MNSIRTLLLLIIICAAFPVCAQSDSTQKVTRVIPFDSTDVNIRHIDEATLAELKTDPDFKYGKASSASTFWERLKRWLARFFRNLGTAAIEADWVTILLKVLAIGVLIYVILRLLRIDALKMFYSSADKSIAYATLDDNIHEMDFAKLIEDAVRNNDYRLAIRLQFLQALKVLSDKNLIHWQPGKTNHDYVNELQKAELKAGFQELNFYFEYAWYGNFIIAPELFGKVKTLFNNWIART